MTIVYRSPKSKEEFKEYFEFRWEMLRKPLGLEHGSEQDELENTTAHIAALNDEKIIGTGRLQLETDNTARIRYMAVANAYQNQGIGSSILKQLEKIAKNKNVQTCWLYARENAIRFYLKNNYQMKGNANSALEIKHFRMEKYL
jgi:N-acetylglutamate synthase-like GNAT family acetyltransferase